MFESEEEEISDEDDYIIKTIAKTENNIFFKIRSAKFFQGYECKECHEAFKNKIALTTHSYSHNRKYLENTEDFDIKSSQNMREFYITDKVGITLKT